MDTHLVSGAVRELEQMIGHQMPLDHFHGLLRRAAQSIQPVHAYGMMQVTCSDEFQGEIRANFERDVARPLMSGSIGGNRHTFALANMGGRLEAGALALANAHFAREDRLARAQLLLVEITSHVGRRNTSNGKVWGTLERFGSISDCCGALATLLARPKSTAVVRHPWFDQLSAFFGAQRLDALRADASPTRMLTAALIHAVLQAESAVADVLREPPSAPTHVLIASLVVINHGGPEEVIPVGVHHLFSDGREASIVHGASLRSTPAALRFENVAGSLRVINDETLESTGERRAEVQPPREFAAAMRAVRAANDDAGKARAQIVLRELQRAHEVVEWLRKNKHVGRVYARPVLRALIQSLSVAAPEVGLAALLVETGNDASRAEPLRRLLAKGPSTEEARKVLHDFEAEIQQLGHRDAQAVLDLLVGELKTLLA